MKSYLEYPSISSDARGEDVVVLWDRL